MENQEIQLENNTTLLVPKKNKSVTNSIIHLDNTGKIDLSQYTPEQIDKLFHLDYLLFLANLDVFYSFYNFHYS